MRVLWGTGFKTARAVRFQHELESKGIECKIVDASTVSRNLLGRHISNHYVSMGKFDRLVHDFKPDVVVSGVNNFGLAAIRSRIPFVINMGGDYWYEIEETRKAYCTNRIRTIVFNHADRLRNKCLDGATMIIAINQSLANRIDDKLPGKLTAVVHEGIDAAEWNRIPEAGNTLQHPCVGLVQNANVWSKAKEMLTLERVIPQLPTVTFYWAGRGPYKDVILKRLARFPNFRYLGWLDYPAGVKQFMSEIDLYLLATGLDIQPSSLKEAQLLERPVLATDAGYVDETMLDGKSGYLVNAGDARQLRTKIEMLLGDRQLATEMGRVGRQFIQKKFELSGAVDAFIDALNGCLATNPPTYSNRR